MAASMTCSQITRSAEKLPSISGVRAIRAMSLRRAMSSGRTVYRESPGEIHRRSSRRAAVNSAAILAASPDQCVSRSR
jgi:hypothetical protein